MIQIDSKSSLFEIINRRYNFTFLPFLNFEFISNSFFVVQNVLIQIDLLLNILERKIQISSYFTQSYANYEVN